MAKKIPMRRCVATNEICPKKELLRVVKDKEGHILVDTTGKFNGHGAYIKMTYEALEAAKKKNALGKALETDIPDSIYDDIKRIIDAE